MAGWVRRALGALVAATALTGALVAAPGAPAVARDLATLRAEAQAIADDVSRLEHRMARLNEEEATLTTRIENTTADLGRIDLEVERTQTDLEVATDRYVARAIAAYKSGPTSDLAMLLSAESLTDLHALAELSSHAAAEDADAVADLIAAKTAAEDATSDVDEHKQQLLVAQARAEEVSSNIRSTLSQRREALAGLNAEISNLKEQARRAAQQAASAGGIDVGQALLDLLGSSGPAAAIPEGFASTGVSFQGIASWYGPGFEGNTTANGDIFDPDLFTAASKELPLGSWLYVEHEGRGVVVLVNDRGPYVGDRILDLSRAAAFSIGITGLGWIKATILVKA